MTTTQKSDAARKTALSYGLAFVAAFALGAPASHALGPADPAFEAGGIGGVLFAVGASTAHAAQGYLGVDVRDVTGDQLATLKLKQVHGAVIIQVDHDAPAGKAGLREHDVVLRLNGQPIAGEDQVRRMLRESAPGKTIVLVISRDGQEMTITAQMANREEVERQAWEQHFVIPEPQNQPAPAEDTIGNSAAPNSPSPSIRGNSFIGTILMSPSYTGAILEKMSPQLAGFFGAPSNTGLLVRSVEANSPAALAGMLAGDVVVRADTRTVASTSDWAKAVKQSHGQALTITVLRDKKEQTLTLTPDAKKRSSLEPLPMPDSGPTQFARLGFSLFAHS
jgi:membrane-associated protease RseP (regulator of RpoE activity)